MSSKARCKAPLCQSAKTSAHLCYRHSFKCRTCKRVIGQAGKQCRSCSLAAWASSMVQWRKEAKRAAARVGPIECFAPVGPRETDPGVLFAARVLDECGAVYLSMPQTLPTLDFAAAGRKDLDEVSYLFPGSVVRGPYVQTRAGVEHTSYRLRYRGAAAEAVLRDLAPSLSSMYKKEIAWEILRAQGHYRNPILAKRLFSLALSGPPQAAR